MDLNQEPLPPPMTPHTPPPTPPPPNKPPDIFTFLPNDFTDDFHSFPFGTYPEDFLKKQGPFIKEAAHQLKQEIADRLCGPLQFRTEGCLELWQGDIMGLDRDQFMAASRLVTLTLDSGYYPHHQYPLLSAQEWASLASVVLAVIGRGYAHTNTNQNEDLLDDIQKLTQDTMIIRSNPPFGNMFDRLTATAEHLHTYLTPDNEGASEWITKLKDKTCFFTDHYASRAIADAMEQWKVHQIRVHSQSLEETIQCTVADSCKSMLIHAANEMGLTIGEDRASMPTPHRNPSCGAKKTTSSSPTPRGRKLTQTPQNPVPCKALPPTTAPLQCSDPSQLDLVSAFKEAMGSVLIRLEALERHTMPLLPPPTATWGQPNQPAPRAAHPPLTPAPPQMSH